MTAATLVRSELDVVIVGPAVIGQQPHDHMLRLATLHRADQPVRSTVAGTLVNHADQILDRLRGTLMKARSKAGIYIESVQGAIENRGPVDQLGRGRGIILLDRLLPLCGELVGFGTTDIGNNRTVIRCDLPQSRRLRGGARFRGGLIASGEDDEQQHDGDEF